MATDAQRLEQPEVELDGVLAEFRTALREEIEAARRSAASSGIQLLNGRKVGQAADAHQYLFSLESVLNLPDDLPGELHLPGRRPVEAAIVSLEGLALTVSVPEDLGDFVPRASLRSDLTLLLRLLIRRIEALAGQPNPAGARLLGEVAPSGELPAERVEGLNAKQAEAVASALGRDTTFIWGPPGTGKTRTIGMIGDQLFRRGRSLLVVSHTNSAVDQAVLEIVRDLGDDLVDGSVLRLGLPKDQRLLESPRLLAETHIKERSQELIERQTELVAERAERQARLGEVERLLAISDWLGRADEEFQALRGMAVEAESAGAAVQRAREQLREREQVAREREAAGEEARALLERAAALEPVRDELERRQALLAQAERRLLEAEQAARGAEALLEEVNAVGGIRRRLRGLPSLDEQAAVVGRTRGEESSARQAREAALARLAETRTPLDALEEELLGFRQRNGQEPAEALAAAEAAAEASAQAVNEAVELEVREQSLRRQLAERIAAVLTQLRAWRLTQYAGTDVMDAMEAIGEARLAGRAELEGVDLDAVRRGQAVIQERLRAIAVELAEIEEALQRVEQDVIADAVVVATTLTRAYKRDSVQARRFDAVILDEASMAPIPALWVVAALADASVVVVGDFKQLAPIKHSEHELAEKWLGRDVFDASGIREAWDRRGPPDHLVQLQVQYRMQPRISAIVNELVYGGSLADGEGAEDDSALDGWYDRTFEHDSPVLLVDTTDLNAWVTSVDTGRRGGSRLNFLSATVCVDLAERLLLPERPELALGERPRILIGSPYRPQTRLVNLLIRDQGLEREVVPGTAHTFQGNEAPVMLFDFVLDEPHFRAGLFAPIHNAGNLRLLNVALTRARRRLILVGDFTWLRQKSHTQSVLRQLVGHLRERYPLVSALEVIPTGFAARAADAHVRMLAGEDAPDARRIVVTQDDYYQLLIRDLARAQERVVFYSAFLTPDRVGFLEPHLRGAVERGVRVYLVTKPLLERGEAQRDSYARIEAALTSWGVRVVHKLRMHEKLVFIDDETLWSGSLNSLSFSDTQEIMERRVSRAVVEDYARILRLAALLAPFESAHDGSGATPADGSGAADAAAALAVNGAPTVDGAACPICGGEMVAAESRNGDPFYWRCLVEDCYSRSIDQAAPRDGRIPCASCGEPVEYRRMPSGAYWRCTANHHHRQRVIVSHLRLPRMRELVPARELRQLERGQ